MIALLAGVGVVAIFTLGMWQRDLARQAAKRQPGARAARRAAAARGRSTEPSLAATPPLAPHTFELSSFGPDGEQVLASADLNVREEALPHLRIQVASPSFGVVDPGFLVTWPLADGLTAVLVIEMGFSETNVTPAQVEAWGASREELWEVALGASTAHAAAEMECHSLGTKDGAFLADLFSSPSNFTGAFGLQMLQLMKDEAVESVFGLPSWCNVVHRTVDEALTINSLGRLARVVSELYEDAATPGAPGLYWHRDGDIVRLDVEHRDDEYTVVGPADLLKQFDK